MEPIRIAAVDDDRLLLDGLSGWASTLGDIELVSHAPTVDAFLRDLRGGVDVVLLELLLRNRTDPAANVERLVEAGHRVLVWSVWSPPDHVVATVAAGASGYLTRDHELPMLAEAIRVIARGGTAFSAEPALSETRPPGPARPKLSPRELAVLASYTSGLTLQQVARRLDIRPETARTYLDRVKAKYREVGRPSQTKLDLARRAQEDGLEVPARAATPAGADRHIPPPSARNAARRDNGHRRSGSVGSVPLR